MSDEMDLEQLQQEEPAEETVIEPDLNRIPGTPEEAAAAGDKKLQINVSRYTKQEWQRAFPDDDPANWERSMRPHALNLFVSNMLMQMLQRKVRPSRIRVVTLDEAYRKWQEENGKENTQETRSEYCRNCTRETALDLMKKNGMDDSIEFLTIPIALTGTRKEERTLYLRKSVAQEITDFLTPFYGEGNVYVPRYIMSLEAGIGIQQDYDRLLTAAAAWFADGTKDAVPELKSQKLSGMRSLCYIPVAIRILHQSADFSMDTVSKEEAAEFNPVVLLGDKRKTAQLPFAADLANIDGFPTVPAPEIIGISLLYQQLSRLQNGKIQQARKEAKEDIRVLRGKKQ